MPLVFSENEATESGISYADRTGVSYEFPKMYRRLVQPGTLFVYYRGRKKKVGRQPQVYFGMGSVGDVITQSSDASRLTCEVLNFVKFEAAVPFKNGRNAYLERQGTRRGYYQRGVREISAIEYDQILRAAKLVPKQNLNQAKHDSVARMAKTAMLTTLNSNGQFVSRRVKNKELSLSEVELLQLIDNLLTRQRGRCAITKVKMQLDGLCSDIALLPSLDRIDSDGHYSAENLQLVCRFVNKWKGSTPDDEFRRLVALVRR